MTTIQVRTKEKTKKTAQKILSALGMDMSTAINLYLVQIIEHKGIPFAITTENGMTPEEEAQILNDLMNAKKSKRTYSSAKEAHKAILGQCS
ncbi:type II toxin-antitoxin system antitoxin, RelB/DinJ family [Candidatus Peregrinibacteria bacterium CG10_big_fil_rev_8_21_14_0_10_49_24]|nr:MAG: type II toxin-antitoxin system antitoxin, RelB/DinJ family [Candidatus Peregrinibacteria bacterium CG11_big_fil_rev_8_21_14_0_20_49_14]PIR51008.1 MAG: type II toxin-antitoxin system antitoxin, RelB/DinJ family [Candidatus Peregrinibacteria bacterium CG10_big_fil_rev_8_21_14_0_10_49_24]PJA67561.1 MAG: type II toxin-antitoxin system antitoxin, RelB/DinJ family [Candidatus Peregrinibacteria bacterium CG_4_9_14_3_um_filter_49_12]